METIDKIIKSSTAPKRKDVVWYDTTTGELKIIGPNGQYVAVSGGSNMPDITINMDYVTDEITVELPDYLEKALAADISTAHSEADLYKYIYFCSASIILNTVTPVASIPMGPVEGDIIIIPDMLSERAHMSSTISFSMFIPGMMDSESTLNFVRNAAEHTWERGEATEGDKTIEITADVNYSTGAISNFAISDRTFVGTAKAKVTLSINVYGNIRKQVINGTIYIDDSTGYYILHGIVFFEYQGKPTYFELGKNSDTGKWELDGETLTEALKPFALIDDTSTSITAGWSSRKITNEINGLSIKFEENGGERTLTYNINPFTWTGSMYLSNYIITEENILPSVQKCLNRVVYHCKAAYKAYSEQVELLYANVDIIAEYNANDGYDVYLYISDGAKNCVYKGVAAYNGINLQNIEFTRLTNPNTYVANLKESSVTIDPIGAVLTNPVYLSSVNNFFGSTGVTVQEIYEMPAVDTLLEYMGAGGSTCSYKAKLYVNKDVNSFIVYLEVMAGTTHVVYSSTGSTISDNTNLENVALTKMA